MPKRPSLPGRPGLPLPPLLWGRTCVGNFGAVLSCAVLLVRTFDKVGALHAVVCAENRLGEVLSARQDTGPRATPLPNFAPFRQATGPCSASPQHAQHASP